MENEKEKLGTNKKFEKKHSPLVASKNLIFKKGASGITLIALVITIIVLLILAAVSIATLTGDNGILTKAQSAKTTNDKAEAEEEMKLLVADWQLEKKVNSSANLGDFLNEKLEKGELDDVTDNKDGSYTIQRNGYEATISDEDGLGDIAEVVPPKEITFKNVNPEETNPAGSMPKGATVVEENGEELNDVDKGIVIRDEQQNEWVWIEVPKSIYKNPDYTKEGEPSGETDYDKITKVLKAYADPYTKGSASQSYNWTDEWYDKLGTTYDGENEYSEIVVITNSTYKPEEDFTEAKEYYGTIYKNNIGTEEATSYASGTKYYARITEKLNDTSGCGLTYSEYQNNYQTMLKSVYNNGGFWIGRYEAGIDGTTESTEENPKVLELARTDSSPRIDISTSSEAISQKDAIPYNFIYCNEAQKLSSQMTPDSNKTSSLLFGIQWDLVCKFIEEKEVKEQGESQKTSIIASINSDSGEWGNYSDQSFAVNNGKSAMFCMWGSDCLLENWQVILEVFQKPRVSVPTVGMILFSTGITERDKKMNIYDFAGNESEYTLERCPDGIADYSFRVTRGGSVADR